MSAAPLRALVLTMVAAAVALGCGSGYASTLCSRFASPNGSNRARGSANAPFGTVQRLVDSLRPGQTGCLRTGVYQGGVRFNHGGRATKPIELRSAPGQWATIVGRIYIPPGSNRIDVTDLGLDGRNADDLPSPTVNSAYDRFLNDDVTNGHTAICFQLGGTRGYERATDVVIEGDRIHDCGVLPPGNHEHGIYVANSLGARIVGNLIYRNADRGIQLYWNAQRTFIAGNVIDHNGEGVIISGDSGDVSSNNVIVNNLITNSTMRADVESWWPSGARGTGNLVAGNCVHGGRRTIDLRDGGFRARANLTVDPGYANPAAGNYSLSSGSVCAVVLGAAGRASARDYGRLSGNQLPPWVHATAAQAGAGGAMSLVAQFTPDSSLP